MSFPIVVDFDASWPRSKQRVVADCVRRWLEVINGPRAPVMVEGRRIDGLVIAASMIDMGAGGTIGSAGPRDLRPKVAGQTAFLPATADLRMDTADFASLEADGRIEQVILHEIGHALGFGIIWTRRGLLKGAGGNNPTFSGRAAMREFGRLQGGGPSQVPLENRGHVGTTNFHWREAIFESELMTSRPSGRSPLSRLSVAAFEDVGYDVNYDAAEAYELPKQSFFKSLSRVFRGPPDHIHTMDATVPTVLPDDAIIIE